MASQVSGNPELGRTSARPKFFCPRTGPEGRSKFDPHFLLAQSKDLDETITETPFSDRESNIFVLDFPHEVGAEHHPEACCNKSKRHTLDATSYDTETPKTIEINHTKGIIAAELSGLRDVESVNLRTQHDMESDQYSPFNLDYDIANQIYRDCCFEELKLQYEANGLDFSKVYSEDFSIHCMVTRMVIMESHTKASVTVHGTVHLVFDVCARAYMRRMY